MGENQWITRCFVFSVNRQLHARAVRGPQEFANIPAPVLFTTNCLMPPKASYADRVFTTGGVSYPEMVHIGEDKDFTPVIDAVKAGAISRFFLVGGCDGAKPGRNYYTEFVKQTPEKDLKKLLER